MKTLNQQLISMLLPHIAEIIPRKKGKNFHKKVWRQRSSEQREAMLELLKSGMIGFSQTVKTVYRKMVHLETGVWI